MKKYSFVALLSLMLISCTQGVSDMTFVGVVVLFVVMIVSFGCTLFFIFKKKRQADKSLYKFTVNIQSMLNKFETLQEKISALQIVIDRIHKDPIYEKDENWKNQVLTKAYLFLATQYHNVGDDTLTLGVCSKIIELDPKEAMTYYNRGSIYSDMGLYDKALQDLSMTIELMPKYASAYNNRGLVHTKLGHQELAIADYSKAIKLDATAVAFYNRANAYIEQEDYENALKDLNSCVARSGELTPDLKKEVESEIENVKKKLL